ncbi:alpha/beta hydrolase [Nocardiopsis rhodophaea]|uniref:alpha/beta fold hydrolase n=1 Tax=Nocardiopsis rhodophaea TaxID=280238 RepID=UPI0031D4894E
MADHYLDVPGASLHYEIHGSGPLLLLLGAPMGSRGFGTITPLLASDHTVLTFDPRGIMRSTDDDTDGEVTVERLTDDVHRLLSAVGTQPAHVFSNSGGTAVGLDLLTTHPEQVRSLVVHEPALIELLPDREELRAALDDMYETYRDVGRNEALKKYAAVTGVDRFSRPPGGGHHEATDLDSFTPPADVRAVLDRFFLHMLRPTARYRADMAALRAAPAPIVVGAATEEKGQLAHRAAVALADELGTTVVDFPGNHTGFQGEPEMFTGVLRQVFSEMA